MHRTYACVFTRFKSNIMFYGRPQVLNEVCWSPYRQLACDIQERLGIIVHYSYIRWPSKLAGQAILLPSIITAITCQSNIKITQAYGKNYQATWKFHNHGATKLWSRQYLSPQKIVKLMDKQRYFLICEKPCFLLAAQCLLRESTPIILKAPYFFPYSILMRFVMIFKINSDYSSKQR